METSAKPILSICVPTYNRVEWLRRLLPTLIRQVAEIGGRVELIISDNNSNDGTEETVDWLRQFGTIRYFRHPVNVGASANFFYIAREMALGDFCWIIGDDDYIKAGAVENLVDVIERNPDIDYIYMNYTSFDLAGFKDINTLEGIKGGFCHIEEQNIVEKWESIISMGNHTGHFTFLPSNIFRTEFWRDFVVPETALNQANNSLYGDFNSVYTTYPHAIIAASNMAGKPAFYIGETYLVMGVGSQEWAPMQNFLSVVRMMDLASVMEKSGVDIRMVRRYRNSIMRYQSEGFWKLIFQKTKQMEQINPIKMLCKYWSYYGFWLMILKYPMKRLQSIPKNLLSRAKVETA